MKISQITLILFRILFVIIFFSISPVVRAQLKYLHLPPHPRILLLQGEGEQSKANIEADPLWNSLHQSIIAERNEPNKKTPKILSI